MEDRKPEQDAPRSEFLDALRKGMLVGLGILMLVLPLRMVHQRQHASPQLVPVPPVAQAPARPAAPAAKPLPAPLPPGHLADFGNENPSPEVKLVANWSVYTRDHGARGLVVVDKKLARVYVFDPQGRLKASSPALLGEAIGDYTTPGVGDKPLWQLKKWEKTTPAGRFVAEMGENSHKQDVVWIDYQNAVSMHRVIKGLPSEHRAQRLASPTYADNRISNGCVNLPKPFYETVLAPMVKAHGAVIYVLPDTRSLQDVLKAWDVTSPEQLALHQQQPPPPPKAG